MIYRSRNKNQPLLVDSFNSIIGTALGRRSTDYRCDLALNISVDST